MSITFDQKKYLIKEYAINDCDTGSTHVQCAILTSRINNITDHLKLHHKDFTSKRGLIMMVNQRRRLLNYLKNKNLKEYLSLISRLGIRK